MVILEGLALCLWLLVVCIIGTAKGAVGMVFFYEPDVQERVVQLKLTTKEEIARRAKCSGLALYLPLLTVIPAAVVYLNGAEGFWECFWQMTAVFLIMDVFDRLFIDWYWVGHTKAWLIPGTEDLMPYIPKQTVMRKWFLTLSGFPILAAILAGAVQLLGLSAG